MTPKQEEKKKLGIGEMENLITNKILRELEAMEPERRADSVVTYLEETGLSQDQANDLVSTEEENVDASLEFNRHNPWAGPLSREEFRMMAWAQMISRRDENPEKTVKKINQGKSLLP